VVFSNKKPIALCNMCHYIVSNSILFIYLFQIGEVSGVVIMHKNWLKDRMGNVRN